MLARVIGMLLAQAALIRLFLLNAAAWFRLQTKSDIEQVGEGRIFLL